jgi:hypothetical protein
MRVLVLTLLTTMLLLSGSQIKQEDDRKSINIVPIPTGAYAASQHEITANAQQISFRFDAPYPSDQVLVFYERFFRQGGYDRCHIPGQKNEWHSFVEQVGDTERVTHQIMHYWVNETKRRLAVVVVRYDSDLERAAGPPDNDVQHVMVILHGGEGYQFEEVRDWLELQCSRVEEAQHD